MGLPVVAITRIAGTGASYAGCSRYASDTSAASITLLRGRTFRALLDVEPSHKSSEARDGIDPPDTESGERLEDQCPYSVRVEWNHKQWISSEPQVKCGAKFSPRTIAIADDGTITSVPAKVSDEQQ